MKQKLKPCPFCGGKAKLYEDYSDRSFIRCGICGVSTMRWGSSDEAESDWNRRVDDEEDDGR